MRQSTHPRPASGTPRPQWPPCRPKDPIRELHRGWWPFPPEVIVARFVGVNNGGAAVGLIESNGSPNLKAAVVGMSALPVLPALVLIFKKR